MSARKEKEKKKEEGKEGNKSKNHRRLLQHCSSDLRVGRGGGDTQTDAVHMNRNRKYDATRVEVSTKFKAQQKGSGNKSMLAFEETRTYT